MRDEKYSSNVPAPIPYQIPSPSTGSGTSAVVHDDIIRTARRTPSQDTVDACAEMFRFCKQCDEKYLQPRNIQCLFDVDSGALHRTAARVIREIIDLLLADIARHGVCQASGASLTVTLKRQHGIWILAVTERCIESLRRTTAVRRLSLVRRRAQLLGAACRVHETGEGFITALMFDSAAGADDRADIAPSSAAVH